jgi:hypothetical protein
MSSSKQLSCKGTLRQVCICLMPPLLLGFCLGWCSNFVGSESGQCMVSNRTQHVLYSTSTQGRRGRVELERRLEGQNFTKLDQKYQHDSLNLLSINSNKHLPQSPFEWVNYSTWQYYKSSETILEFTRRKPPELKSFFDRYAFKLLRR